MKSDNLLVIFVVGVILIVLINISVVFIKISDFEREMSGLVSSGYVNLSVNTIMTINLTRASLNWGSGRVNAGNSTGAILYTSGNKDGTVIGGSWTGSGVNGFIVENIGNINASLKLKTGKNASDIFAGSSGSNQEYKLNVTNKEPGSCSGGVVLGEWVDVNVTSPGTKYCNQFSPLLGSNEIFVDVWLKVPYDTSNLGTQSDILTITASAAT